MEQSTNVAAVKDAKIKLRKEECAGGMGQGLRANTRDAPIMLRKEECARGMGQRSNDAAVKDVQM